MIHSPFAVNYRSLEQVKKFAIKLARECGKKMVVFKHPDRNNYNITFHSRIDRYALSWVVFTTE